MRNRNLIIRSLAFVVLCLSGSLPVLGQDCEKIVIGKFELVDMSSGEENCGAGYDSCYFSIVRGTLNGFFNEYSSFADDVQVEGSTWSYKVDAVVETKKGNLNLTYRSIVDWAAPDGFALAGSITGGTGLYEGATGWLVSFADWNYTMDRYAGEVCYAEED